jgi:hypothetical protein
MMHPRYRPEIARASVIRLRFPDRLVSCQSASAVFQTDHCAEARRFQSNVDAATILKPYCWSVAMNLRTLVTACALTVDPKIMHALIRHQSGGEPWAFSVSGHQPQVLRAQGTPSMQARHLAGRCRHTVGLAGLPGAPRTSPRRCSPRASTSLQPRVSSRSSPSGCSSRSKDDPIHCAVAAWRGSWQRPDNGFADAVRDHGRCCEG